MSHDLHLTADEDYTGTLTLGAHPDGELDFEDGAATVEDRGVAETLAERYPNIRLVGEVDADSAGRTDDSTDEDEADPPLDPGEYNIDELEAELENGDYTEAELEAIREAEVSGEDRDGATDAIDAALVE